MVSYQSIQLLRWIAATMVMLAHVGVGQHSYKGIDLLFAISGFVIYLSSYQKMGSGVKTAINFFKKRCIRVYSFYWLTLFSLLLSGLYSLAYDFNYLKVVFLIPSHQSFLSLTWSLSYELYFYVLIGLVIAFLKPMQAQKALIGFWLISSILLLLQWTDYSLKRKAINFLVGQNIWQILSGCLACMYFIESAAKSKASHLKIAVLFFCGMLLFFAYASYYSTLSFLLTGLGSASIVLSLALLEERNRIPFPQLFIRLGNASYVAYLIHIPLFHFFRPHINQNLAMQCLLIFVVWAISVLLHELIEKPMVYQLNQHLISKKSN